MKRSGIMTTGLALAIGAVAVSGCNRPPFSGARASAGATPDAPPPATRVDAVAPVTRTAAPTASIAPTAAAAATPAAPAAKAATTAHLTVRRLVVAKAVENRLPVEPSDSFAAGDFDRLYAYVEIQNAGPDEGEIVVSFEPEDGPSHGNVTLPVGRGARWRTWAFTRGARKPGAWQAVVRAPDGKVLARTAFQITS